MEYLFGPVPSRRLGLSLGVDLVPYKVCSYNCIYCEVGETTSLTVKRREYVPLTGVKKELEAFWATGIQADYITFSGFGEPTLHSGLGELTRWIKSKTDIPIALLTNASLFWLPQVREEASLADVVLPSLDAVSEKVFNKINRPHTSLNVHRILEGLFDFSSRFSGEIWLEILFVRGINDSEEEVKKLARVVGKISPHRIQLNTVTRPPAVNDTCPVAHQELEHIAKMLPGYVEIVGISTKHSASEVQAIEKAILDTVKRRPCTVEDLVKVTGTDQDAVKATVKGLIIDGDIEGVKINGSIFYKYKTQS